jgi:hypothetical protein
MTQRLEDLFNLAAAKNTPDTIEHPSAEQHLLIQEIDDAIDKIDDALPTVRDLDASDKEMDELANLAKENFQNLMELGMSVDSRFSGQIFQTAGNLLGHAITAKQAKLDKKLRMVDLQLKKAALDLRALQMSQKSRGAAEMDVVEGEGVVMDRNELIRSILGKSAAVSSTDV